MDSDSLLWVDGNTNGATVEIPAGTPCRYNIDTPTSWPPMSVLSGLASGFCERRAILDSAFGDTVWDTVQHKNTIVHRCAQGFALGVSGSTLFNAGNDASFRLPENTTDGNYMTAVDAAITTLITGATTYVKPDGTPYGTTDAAAFAGLATAADARADLVAGSAIVRPTSDGYAYQDAGMLLYPAAWAKQRKWLLDELRYTGAASVVVDPISIIGDVYDYSAGTTIAAGHTNVNDYYTLYLAGATQSSQGAIWGGIEGTVASAPVASVFMRAGAAQIASTQNTTSITQWETAPWLVDNASRAVLTRPANGLYLTRTATTAEAGAVKIDLTQIPPLAKDATIPICVYAGETSVFTSATNDLIYVFSGGTAIFQDNKTNYVGYHAVIFSGGVASAMATVTNNVHSAAKFNDLCILTGGTFSGPKAAFILHQQGFYADPACAPYNDKIYVIDGVSSQISTDKNASSFFLVNGGTLTVQPGGDVNIVYVGAGCVLSAGSSAVTNNTAQAADEAKLTRINYVTVDSGGYAYLGHATRDIDRFTVLRGASVYADVYQDKLTSDAYIDSDCDVTINYLAGNEAGTMPFTENAELTMASGGLTDIQIDGATTTYPRLTINVYRSTDDVNNALARSVDIHIFDPMGLHVSGGSLVTEGFNICPAVFAQGSTVACVITAEGSTTATNVLQQPPASNMQNTAGCRLIGTNNYNIHYNCAVAAIYATPSGAGVTNHYEGFRVRQWPTDPAAT